MTTTNRQTVKELTPALGAVVMVRFEELAVRCTVVDAKAAWGKVRLLVEPVAGEGAQWVELGRLMTSSVATPESMQEAQEAAREQARRAAQLDRENRRLNPEDYSNEGSY